MTEHRVAAALLTLGLLAATPPVAAAEWPNWRGPDRNAVSAETGLVSSWSKDGENLMWRQPFVGRSAPVVFAGRACANGRAGEDIHRQEMVACFDALTGEPLWERRFNVYQTTVPWTRVGWANVTGDPETGYLYVQGVGGTFLCLDSRDGSVVWERNLIEELGFMEGYGGRTQTPAVDQDRLIVTFASTSWGDQARPLHRVYAFDKRTGELLWSSSPASSMADKNAQSTPAIAVIDGRRQVVVGLGDGGIYGLEARTGKKIWEFHLSKRAINMSVVVEGTTVYASHSEENVDEGTMGRVVAIDATGSGDVTKTHETWRAPIAAGFSSLVVQGGRAYVMDNSANLHALDAGTGETLWNLHLGTVGKGSPVWADGKLFVTEVNGRFHIVEPSPESGKVLDTEVLSMPEGRPAEIYSSPAVAYGNLYFTTEEGFYCVGDPERDHTVEAGPPVTPGPEAPAPADATAASILVIPADVEMTTQGERDFRVEAFDALGRPLGAREAAWSLDGLEGTVTEGGVFRPSAEAGSRTGLVTARVGDHIASARVRVLSGLPIVEDFESTEAGSRPGYFHAYLAAWKVEELEGQGKVLAKPPSPVKIDRHITFLGSKSDRGYTIEADLMGTRDGRRVPDMGLINSGYTVDVMGAHQAIELRSWASELRMAHRVDFAWETGVWYRVKLRVDATEASATIRAKVWKRGEPEPEAWTTETEDPHPIIQGSPGLYGYSPATIYFDNISVTRN